MPEETRKAKPFILSGPEVRAALDGSKTQVRRAIKDPCGWSPHNLDLRFVGTHPDSPHVHAFFGAEGLGLTCPHGKPGDRLWVRETWALEDLADDGERIVWQEDRAARWRSNDAIFWLDAEYRPSRWRSPACMPRWASRLTLEVTDVRVERLQDISEEDAQAEGVEAWDGALNEAELCAAAKRLGCCAEDASAWYAVIWDLLNGKRASWDSNPWVWALTFKVVP